MASTVKKVFTANLCIYILGVNSSNGGITNPKCGDGYSVPQGQGASFFCRPSLYGRYVTIRRHDERTIALNFCEVEVYSARRGTEPSAISVSSSYYYFFFNPKKTKKLWANLCLNFCFINIWLSLFDEANEIKSLIKRPYQNLSPINRIALEKLSLKNSNFYKEYVSSNSKHFCHPAISPILIAAISFFNTCKELKIPQTTNNVSNDVNHIILMLGYGYPELFCPAVKQHNIGADILKQ